MMGKKFVGIGCLFSVLLLPFDASAQEATTVQGSKSKVQSLDGGRGKTWKTVTELSAEEKAGLDLRTNSPRDGQFPYLPAEKFPFTAPYTAEEMGLRAAEFPHSPYWNCTLIDIAATITNTGFLDQRVTIIPILYLPQGGFAEQLYATKPGQEVYRWLSQSVSPPERYGNQTLYVGYRNDQAFTTKLDLFAYSPALRRVRRQPQPRREDRLPNNAATFDDLLSRDAWEFSWRLLGTDTLHQTVRFPVTKQSTTLTDEKGNYIDVAASDVKLMGPDYPLYTAEGGVKCYVIEAIPRPDWLKNYYLSKIIYWVDQQSFFPLRIEEYDREGKLVFINARTGVRANPALGDRGYAVLFDLWWDMTIDLLSASIHGILSRSWSEDDKKIFFSPGFMRREWFLEPPKTLMVLNSPDEFYLRPTLDREKFPEERKIVLTPELEARIQAQEQAGRLVF
jgi:outer membrane lipoprotein-sorting protein